MEIIRPTLAHKVDQHDRVEAMAADNVSLRLVYDSSGNRTVIVVSNPADNTCIGFYSVRGQARIEEDGSRH